MSLLDTVVDETVQRPVVLANEVNQGIERFGNRLPFRGLLTDVRGLRGVQLAQSAGLDWKTVPLPVDVRGKRESRQATGYQALVRSDNGGILSITSDKFKAHQNADMLADMSAIADAGDATIVYAGSLDEGRKVVAIAQLHGEFHLPGKINNHAGNVEGKDTTHLYVIISGGHEVGTPYRVRGLAFRLWCLNGAFFTRAANSTLVITHRSDLKSKLATVRETFDSIAREFESYGDNARKLQVVPANKAQERLYVAEVLRPGFAEDLGHRILGSGAPQANQQAYEILGEGAQVSLLDQMIAESEGEAGFQRLGKRLIDSLAQQTGRNGDTLWSAYNGITYHVDHVRGRNDASGVDAALFGSGATLKERALEVALNFAS